MRVGTKDMIAEWLRSGKEENNYLEMIGTS
jgi:hypothetical protein